MMMIDEKSTVVMNETKREAAQAAASTGATATATDTAAVTATDSATATANKNTNNTTNKPPPEYNPRWKGYIGIAVMSLILFASVLSGSSLDGPSNPFFEGYSGLAVAWGVLTFFVSVLVLLLDGTQCFADTFNYTKAWDGKFEGYTLLFLVVFWITGVGFITQVDGVAYLAMNTYLGSWLTLFACGYTLNEWSASKDILTVEELTSVSATLKSWYVLFLGSLVVMGTSINYLIYSNPTLRNVTQNDAAVSAALSCVSWIVSLGWVFVHYNFIEFVSQGGWVEFLIGAALVVMWIVVVAIVTQEGGVGSTVVGTACGNRYYQVTKNTDELFDNCTFTLWYQNSTVEEYSCMWVLQSEVPGSNLYVFTWVSLLSSLNVCLRWKAQQALQFAQTRTRSPTRTRRIGGGAGGGGGGGGGGNVEQGGRNKSHHEDDDEDDDYDDDDDDLEDFQDAKNQ